MSGCLQAVTFFYLLPMEKIVVIGAGPAGLACAAILAKNNIPFELLEQANTICPAWHNHYDRLALHTVKSLSALPYLPFPDAYPTYVPKAQLLTYFDDYIKYFDIKPNLNTTVQHIEEKENGWTISTSNGEAIEGSQIIITTGFNRVPYSPEISGLESFTGSSFHSKDYKNPKQLEGDRILVVGMGNSGAEIALDLALNGKTTYLSVRGPVNIVPRDFLGNPTQLTAKKLASLPPFIGDRLGRLVQYLSIGNLNKYGIKRPNIFPAKQLRTLGKTPVIDLGTVAEIKKGNISIRPGIKAINGSSVQFTNNQSTHFDHIIFATGYQSAVEQFAPFVQPLLNEHGHPGQFRHLTKRGNIAYFVGFNAYASGLLESMHTQALELEQMLSQK
mgnify:CR=1 FL=1